jgi:hypothetical protein
MRHINGVYTQRFNAAHGLDGPLFRGRYKAMLVGEGSYLLQLIRYVHKNPVRAGKVESVEQYEWSSHRGYLSAAKKWDWLHKRFILSMIAKDPKQRIKRYRMFMAEDESESFLQTMNLKRLPSVLGENQFLKMIKERYFERKRHVEVPESKGLAPETDQIIAAVCRLYGIDTRRLFHAKRGNLNEARSMAIYLGCGSFPTAANHCHFGELLTYQCHRQPFFGEITSQQSDNPCIFCWPSSHLFAMKQ